jgi:hypothetical protein
MAILVPITKSQYEVTFTCPTAVPALSLVAVFTKFSGINDNSDSSTYANGTGNRIYHVVGPRTAENVTLTAPYDPNVFIPLEKFWLKYNCEPITITVTPRSCNGEAGAAGGGQYVCYECQFMSIKTAEVDRSSADVQEIEVEFTVNYFVRT